MRADYPRIDVIIFVGTFSTGSEALVDTACSAGAIIPASCEEEIDAAFEWEEFTLGDGRRVKVPAWDGLVDIEGRVFDARVSAIGNEVLVGMQVLSQLEITLSFGREIRMRFGEES